jgi:hypothetical protein
MTNGNDKSKMINDKWKMENRRTTDYGLLTNMLESPPNEDL